MNSTKDELSNLKEDLGRLGKSIEKSAFKTGAEFMEKTEEALSDLADRAKKAANPTIKSFEEKRERVDNFVKEKPWLSVGIALAAGLFLGSLFGRNRG